MDGERFSKSDVQNPGASNMDVSRLKTRSRIRLINLYSLSLVLSTPPCNLGIREVRKKNKYGSNCGLLSSQSSITYVKSRVCGLLLLYCYM